MQLSKQALTKTIIGILRYDLDSQAGRLEAAPGDTKNAWAELTANAEVM